MDRISPQSLTDVPIRIHGPDDLLQVIPYLLGFHPADSLVVIGLVRARVVVSMRVDLDADSPAGLAGRLVAALYRAAATEAYAVIYSESWPDGALRPYADLVVMLGIEAHDAGVELVDGLFVSQGRRWSYRCSDESCCPAAGTPIDDTPGVFATAATVAGMVALPSRADLVALLDPVPDRDRLDQAIAEYENAAVQAALDGRALNHARSVKRAIFAAARRADTGAPALLDAQVARFGAGLCDTEVRDAVWLAIDDGRLDGFELWRDLARRLPPPYDAPPLFLAGWTAWRSGNNTIAAVAAQRAIESDPDYNAADLLAAATSQGVDPRSVPRLRSRSA